MKIVIRKEDCQLILECSFRGILTYMDNPCGLIANSEATNYGIISFHWMLSKIRYTIIGRDNNISFLYVQFAKGHIYKVNSYGWIEIFTLLLSSKKWIVTFYVCIRYDRKTNYKYKGLFNIQHEVCIPHSIPRALEAARMK